MNTILDIPEQKPQPADNLRKSLRLYFVYAAVIVVLIGAVIFVSVTRDREPGDLFYSIVGLVFLVTLLLGPVGVYYAVKAWLKKEGSALQRVFHTIGHGVVLLLLVWMIFLVVNKFIVVDSSM